MFYAVPDFHNPTGVCWATETRQKVAELCIKYNVAFIEMRLTASYALRALSCQWFLHRSALTTLSFFVHSLRLHRQVIRIGAVTGKRSYLEPLIKVKQGADLHSSVPMQALLVGLLKHEDFNVHMENIRTLYKSRYEVLFSELEKQLPADCVLKAVDGGMFIWVEIPECDTFELAKTLLSNGVAVV